MTDQTPGAAIGNALPADVPATLGQTPPQRRGRNREGFVGQDRRRIERRIMPPHVRSLVEGLRSELRRPGAQSADGREWRTVEKHMLEAVIGALAAIWREEGDD